MSVWVRAAAELLIAVASFFIPFFLEEWGPFLGISLAQPIFHLNDPGHVLKKKLYVFLAISTPNCVCLALQRQQSFYSTGFWCFR